MHTDFPSRLAKNEARDFNGLPSPPRKPDHFPQMALNTVIVSKGRLDRHPAPFETVAPRPPQGENSS
jgi:hypothetical protein